MPPLQHLNGLTATDECCSTFAADEGGTATPPARLYGGAPPLQHPRSLTANNRDWLTCAADEGHSYSARISTRRGFMTARLPFSVFRPEDPAFPPDLDPSAISAMGVRFDRSPRQANIVLSAEDTTPL